MDAAQGGSPTMLLDLRMRPVLTQTADRAALIDEAKAKYSEFCDQMLAAGLADTLETCSIAFFHGVLTSDGSLNNST
eukprot:3887729-Prymnesium_polylepis.1